MNSYTDIVAKQKGVSPSELDIDDMRNELIEHNGALHQILCANEELAELIQALNKYERCVDGQERGIDLHKAISNVKIETADVYFVLGQIKMMFGFTDEDLKEIEIEKGCRALVNSGCCTQASSVSKETDPLTIYERIREDEKKCGNQK